jgi:hypothetical protein
MPDQDRERACAYRILRYAPNLVRDEWVNIGVLLFEPGTGERRLRMTEEQDEYDRMRRLHSGADQALLRALRDDLEDRFQSAAVNASKGGSSNWQQLLGKWDDTLSNVLQLAPQKGVWTADLDAELERLYADHVAMQRTGSGGGARQPGPNALVLLAGIPASPDLGSHREVGAGRAIHFPGRPHASRRQLPPQWDARIRALHLRHPGTGRAQALAYNAERITAKAALKTEFAAVTDVLLNPGNDRHCFVRDTLLDAGIEPVAMEGFAVWVAKLKPLLQ